MANSTANKPATLVEITGRVIKAVDVAIKAAQGLEACAAEYAIFYKSRRWITEPVQAEQARTEFLVEDVMAKHGGEVKKYLGDKVNFDRFYRAYKANKSAEHRKTVFAQFQHDAGINEKTRLEKALGHDEFAKQLRELEVRSNARWAKMANAARKYLLAEIEPQEPESEEDKAYGQWNKPLVKGVENVDKAMLAFFNKYQAKDKASYDKLEPAMREAAKVWGEFRRILKESTIVVTE